MKKQTLNSERFQRIVKEIIDRKGYQDLGRMALAKAIASEVGMGDSETKTRVVDQWLKGNRSPSLAALNLFVLVNHLQKQKVDYMSAFEPLQQSIDDIL